MGHPVPEQNMQKSKSIAEDDVEESVDVLEGPSQNQGDYAFSQVGKVNQWVSEETTTERDKKDTKSHVSSIMRSSSNGQNSKRSDPRKYSIDSIEDIESQRPSRYKSSYKGFIIII